MRSSHIFCKFSEIFAGATTWLGVPPTQGHSLISWAWGRTTFKFAIAGSGFRASPTAINGSRAPFSFSLVSEHEGSNKTENILTKITIFFIIYQPFLKQHHLTS